VTRDLIAKLADLRDRGHQEAGFLRGMEKILSNLTGRKRDRNLTALKNAPRPAVLRADRSVTA
jgi:hypothetical protein